jgi:chromosome segregation ATPase
MHLAILQGVWREVESQQHQKQKLKDVQNLLDIAKKEVAEYVGKLKDSEDRCVELSNQMSASNDILEKHRAEVESCHTEIANYRKIVAELKQKVVELNTKPTAVKNTIVNEEEKKYNPHGRVIVTNGNEVFSARANVFSFIKTFCNNKNIKESSTMVSAKVKYRKLSEALYNTYHIELSEFTLQSFSTVGELVDTIWQELV